MRVHRFSTTPVKATALHHPGRIRVEGHGVDGDRAFLFTNHDGTYKDTLLAPLMPIVAAYEEETLRFTLPDGTQAEGSAAPGDPTTIRLWGRDLPGHTVPGPWDEMASDLVGAPVRLARPDEPGAGQDEMPVTLASLASVAELADALGVPSVDPARFRMTIDLDDAAAREEDGLAGRTVRIGTAELRLTGLVPRCVVTTWNPATGVRDLDTLKAIRMTRGRTEEGLPLGVYAEVLSPGDVAVGDEVEVLG